MGVRSDLCSDYERLHPYAGDSHVSLVITGGYMWETPKHVEKIMEKCREVATLYNRKEITQLQMLGRFIDLRNAAENQKVTLTWDASGDSVKYSVRYAIH